MVLGIVGFMGSGKDVVADLLKYGSLEFKRIAFADELKNEVVDFATNRKSFLTDPHFKEASRLTTREVRAALRKIEPEWVWEKPTRAGVRKVLQWWGTEYRRVNYGDEYWIHRLSKKISRPGNYVISDVRYQNEVDFIRTYRPNFVVKIVGRRAESGDFSHSSERFIEGLNADYMINNSGTLLQLRAEVTCLEGRLGDLFGL